MFLEKNSYFDRFCPNCGRRISDDRLIQELVCPNCLSTIDISKINELKSSEKDELILKPLWYYFYNKINNKQNIKNLKEFFDNVEDFIKFFETISGKSPWSLQITWAKRVITKQSFSIIAPTGVGKTTWWLIMGLYLWRKKNISKIYYILPTTVLTIHTFERFKILLENYCNEFGVCKKDIFDRILVYHWKLKNKEKKEIKNKIKEWNFDILFSTTNFLYRDFEILKDNIWKFKFIFIDDVDSLLKSAKNIDYVLRLMWYPQDIIDLALKLVTLKIRLLTAKWTYLEKLTKEINEIKEKINKFKNKIDGILVASSATAKPKWIKIKLLRELLNFEVWRSSTSLRNIDDFFVDWLNLDLSLSKEDRYNKLLNFYEKKIETLLKLFKNWILFFLPSDLGKDFVNPFVEYLNTKWFKSISYENLSDETIEQFREWKINILVWIASWRNPLARWLDLPDAVKYAIFLWVPKFVFNVELLDNPRALISVILNLWRILTDELKEKFSRENKIVNYLKFLNKISNYSLEYIQKNEDIKQKLDEIYNFITTIIQTDEVKQLLSKSDEIAFDWERFIIADVAAYIQASGRTSRMYIWGLTKWLSIILVDNKKSFTNLQKRIKWFYDDIEFKKLDI